MNDWSQILGGWAVVAVAMAWFTWRTVRRGKMLAREVPDEDKPWA